MQAVDTNVLVRLLVRDDPHQTASAETFVAKGAWVSILVLAETSWVLTTIYRLTGKELAQVVEMLLNHQVLVLQDAETVSAALVQFRAKPAVGFSDCLILQLASRSGHLPLGTFDRNLAKLEGTKKL